MKINIERVCSRLEEIYQCGKKEDGTHTRMAFSEEDIAARELYKSWAKKLGLKVRMDAAGNLLIRLQGKDPYLPSIVMGSHLDTVPDGGKYDGALGCVGALEVCETLLEDDYVPEHPIEIIIFTDEEGFRFNKGLLGSSSICGRDLDISDDDLDIYGESRGHVMESYGIDSEHVSGAERELDSIYCFLELHVEQGSSLDKKNVPVGIVSSIAGIKRYEITVTGEANHAGSTAMADRKDALVAAAGFINQLPEMIKEHGSSYTVATVGTIKVTPHSVNVIPGTCTFSMEIRDQSTEMMQLIEEKARELLDCICEKYRVTAEFNPISFHEPGPMCGWVKDVIEKAVKKQGYDYEIIPSGAFHDSTVMASKFSTGMIFVPSVGGISHSREEYTEAPDIEKGCNVLLQTVLDVDNMSR